MFYKIMKSIFQLAIKIYFKKIYCSDLSAIPKNQPLVFVSNHQSAFMDAILLACLLDVPLHFLSRGESFNTPFRRWILAKFNMNPIYRKEFSPELTHKNPGLIEAYQQLLIDRKAMLIFPEGISRTEYRMRPVKKGTARIILGAEAANQYKLGTQIIPIGLNYSNPHKFRSEVYVNIGAAIPAKEYAELHEANPAKAVNELTKRIEDEIAQRTIIIEEKELEALIFNIESIYKEELNKFQVAGNYTKKLDFTTRKKIIDAVHYFYKYFPEKLEYIQLRVRYYQQSLQLFQLKDQWLSSKEDGHDFRSGLPLFFYLLASPIFLYGFVSNYMLYRLPKFLADKLTPRADFYGSMLLAFGVLCFLIFYPGQILLFAYWSQSILASLVYAISLPTSGWFALKYYQRYQDDQQRWKKLVVIREQVDNIDKIQQQRKKLIFLFKKARQEYLQAS